MNYFSKRSTLHEFEFMTWLLGTLGCVVSRYIVCISVNNTSVPKYWKVLFYPANTDTGAFYGGSTDIDTDAQYPKFNTDILVFPVFYSISILCFKPLIGNYYLRLLALYSIITN